MRVLISGILHDAPAIKTSAKTGAEFCCAKIKDDSGTFAGIVCFSELAGTLAGCSKGDSVAVSGSLKVDIYNPPNGDPRPNLSITADSIITLKATKKPNPAASNYKKNQDSKSSGFDINKFKGVSGYVPKPPPPPPAEGDPF